MKKTEDNNLKVDESTLKDEEKSHYQIPFKGFIIVFSILLVLIAICIIVIFTNGGPINGASSS